MGLMLDTKRCILKLVHTFYRKVKHLNRSLLLKALSQYMSLPLFYFLVSVCLSFTHWNVWMIVVLSNAFLHSNCWLFALRCVKTIDIHISSNLWQSNLRQCSFNCSCIQWFSIKSISFSFCLRFSYFTATLFYSK